MYIRSEAYVYFRPNLPIHCLPDSLFRVYLVGHISHIFLPFASD